MDRKSLSKMFEKANLNIRLNLGVVAVEAGFTANLQLTSEDKKAAWELYIEMLTRIVTQPLPTGVGDEQAALDSVYSLFETTREILRKGGPSTIEFSQVAIPVLNQVVRPFTAKWHMESVACAFDKEAKRSEFRKELAALQKDLRSYNRLLANIACVEDLTDLEVIEGE